MGKFSVKEFKLLLERGLFVHFFFLFVSMLASCIFQGICPFPLDVNFVSVKFYIISSCLVPPSLSLLVLLLFSFAH